MVKLRTLGECVAEIGSTRLGPDAERLFAVLLCLGLERERLASRSALSQLLWPDVPDGRAAHCLRQAVYRLRALGVAIRSDRSNLWLTPDSLAADCAPLLGHGLEPDEYAEQIQGTFLPGYHPKFSDRYAEWVERQRDLVNARIRRVFLAAIARLKARGDWIGVECIAARCLAIDPLNEEATLARAEAAALQGGKTQALAILDGYLREVGPQAREIRLPASVLRRRIAEATNLERPRAITETPFFGRASEMAELNRGLQLAHRGAGSAYLFWGEPGIGKTRLTQEFNRAISLGHAQVIRVGCQSNDDRRPLSMFVDMLPRLMAMPGALGCSPTALRYLRRLTDRDPQEPLASMDPRDAAAVYGNIRRSMLDLLDAVASEGLLVVTIEDVHWLDMGSWDVIADALPWLTTRRVLLLLTSREPDPERKRGIGELPGLQRRHLPPLDRSAVDALSSTIVERSGKELPADVAEWCAQACGGNPYHLAELVLHALREGQVAKLPASLSQLISERLARLQPLSLHVLQAVSVLGAQSTADRLERLLDQRRVDLLESLDELERSGLIESEPSRLVAKHELLSQAAVQRLSVSARRLLHRHAARILERDGESSPAPAMQWACAEHWREAGEVGRALQYLQECARYALESGAPSDALELLDRALLLARDDDDRHSILMRKARALQHHGNWLAIRDLLASITHQNGDNKSDQKHSEEELLQYQTAWRTGVALDATYPALLDCVSSPHATVAHRLEAGTIALTFCDNDRRRDLAEAFYKALSPFIENSGSDLQEALTFDVIYQCCFGSMDKAEKSATQLARVAAGQKRPSRRVRGLMICATALREVGREIKARRLFQEAHEEARKHEMLAAAASSAISIAALCIQHGEMGPAHRWLEVAREFGSRSADATVGANILGLQIRLMLQEQVYDGIQELSDQYSRNAPNARLKYLTELMRIRISLRLGNLSHSLEDTLRRLHEVHFALRDSFSSDLSAIAIVEALRFGRATEEADRFLSKYVASERRSRCTLAIELREPWGQPTQPDHRTKKEPNEAREEASVLESRLRSAGHSG